MTFFSVCFDSEKTQKSVYHKGVQVNLRRSLVRSKSVSCNIAIPVADANCSPIKIKTSSVTTSQIKAHIDGNSKQSSGDTLSTVLSSVFPTSSNSYEPSSEEGQEIEKTIIINKCNAMQFRLQTILSVLILKVTSVL